MPIILLAFLAALTLGWFDRPSPTASGDCLDGQGELQIEEVDAFEAPEPPAATWQEQCVERFEAARAEAAAFTALGELASGSILTEDSPGGDGGVWFNVMLPGGVRYSAGVSGVQAGELDDTEWYSLNGVVEPRDRFSWWKDEDGRSGFVAGLDDPRSTAGRAFKLVFQRAIDDCLEIDE